MVYLGFDPAGKGKFGAVALREADEIRQVVAAQTVESVADALDFACAQEQPVAAAIDGPLTWSSGTSGWRQVDLRLRRRYPQHRNKVISTNSLFGSVAVQAPALGMLLGKRFPSMVISETHPKLTCVALGLSTSRDSSIRATRIIQRLHLSADRVPVNWTDDIIDALVAAHTAWAAYNKPIGWTDLLSQVDEPSHIYPLGKERSVYFFPAPGG